MLIFSGATLPYEVMPGIMQKIVDILPLTQGIKILKASTLVQNGIENNPQIEAFIDLWTLRLTGAPTAGDFKTKE